MKTKVKYMQGAEFKARQLWLPFTDAAGIALQIMAEVKEKSAAWLKKWIKNFRCVRRSETSKPEQLTLCFESELKKFWAEWTPEQNRVLFA